MGDFLTSASTSDVPARRQVVAILAGDSGVTLGGDPVVRRHRHVHHRRLPALVVGTARARASR